MEQVLEWIWNHIWTVIVILSCFIEITPIKWNPLSSAFKWIGKIITLETREELKQIKTDLNTQKSMIEENEKDRIRWEILEFANSCRNDQKHTKDEFQHIITLNDKYKKLLESTNDKNGVFEAEYKFIEELYAERQKKNDFL